MSRQELQHASALYTWSAGSLAGRDLTAAFPLAVGVVALLPLAWLSVRRLSLLRFDADMAATLGLARQWTQWQALLTAVVLAGLAIGICGPIAFVALSAPVFASRLAGEGRMGLLPAGLIGSVLVVTADTIGRVVLGHAELPAGVICNLLGGPFLLWLLLSDRKEGVA
nr:iron chelate uptake ABC transporter family permease subunit [Chitinivorax sp. B]